MSTHVSSWWKLDFEWLISVGSFGSLPNVRMKNKTSECIKFGCERSDTNREQWFRIRIPKSELSGDGPLLVDINFRSQSHSICCNLLARLLQITLLNINITISIIFKIQNFLLSTMSPSYIYATKGVHNIIYLQQYNSILFVLFEIFEIFSWIRLLVK